MISVVASWRHTRSGRIAAAVSSGAAARILSSLASLISIPLAVRYLGGERFGVWATITSTFVFLNLLDLGIASTLTNHVARSYAFGERECAARYMTNALVLTVSVACGSGVVLAVVWPHINWISLFGVAPLVPRDEVAATAAFAATLMLIGLPASLASKVFAGYQQVHLSSVIVACGTIGNLGGLLIGVESRASMPWLFLMSTGCLIFCNAAALVGIWWFRPWLRPRREHLAWSSASELLSSGSGFFLIQIAGAVVFSSDNVVVGHYLGAAQVTPYNVAWRLVGLTAVLQSLVFPALWPAYSEAYVRGDLDWVRRTFRLIMCSTFALNLTCAAVFVLFGKPMIRWWAGPTAVPSTILLVAMGMWAVISGCMTAESCLLAALNRTRLQGVLSVVAAAVNLALSVVLVQRVGVVGVIGGTILSYLLILVVPQSVMVKNVLREPRPDPFTTKHRSLTASRVAAVSQ